MKPDYEDEFNGISIYQGNCLEVLKQLPDATVNCCVTSPPYFNLRDYHVEGQIGQEKTIEEYVDKLCEVFDEVKRVLKDDGTLWLNLGDSYAGGGGYAPNAPSNQNGKSLSSKQDRGSGAKPKGIKIPDGLKPKDVIGIPWRVAFALQYNGWYLRQDLIWFKPNPMPESVTDRCTKAHEYIFLLSKSGKYYYDADAIAEEVISNNPISSSEYRKEIGRTSGNNEIGRWCDTDKSKPIGNREDGKRNKRSVWTVTTQSFPEAHFATFPIKLIEPCILAGCSKGGVVLDPFLGSGTTMLVAMNLGRKGVGIELNEEYVKIAIKRMGMDGLI